MNKKTWIIFLIIGTLGVTVSLIYLFSWTNNNSSTPKDTNIEQITTTKQKNLPKSSEVQNPKSSEISINLQEPSITVLLPDMFFNEDFLKLAQILKSEKNITIHYQTIEDPQNYKNMIQLQQAGYNDIDIFLIPTSWLQSFENHAKVIDLGEKDGLKPYVHHIFHNIVDQEKYTFIPHNIDPLVTFVAKESNINVPKLNIAKILSYLSLYKEDKKLQLPIIWGIDKNDIRSLQYDKQTFPNYFDILYRSIYQFDQANDIEWLKTFLNISTFSESQQRSFLEFKQLYEKITKRNTNCESFPDTCLLAYKFSDIKRWYLSDQIILDKYFAQSTRKTTDLQIYNFPLSTDVYKVRGRGFLTHQQTNNTYAVKLFFKEYLKAAMSKQTNLRNNTLSAFNSILDLQKTQKKYQTILIYESNFSLIYAALDTQKQFLTQTDILALLKNKITPQNFLQTLQRTR